MNKQKFILWIDKPVIRENAIRAIQGLPEGSTWEISIKLHVNSKTAQQRAWFHTLCGLFGEQIGMTMGQVKEIAKAQVFGWKHIEYGGISLTLADGHSESLNLKQYSDLIETVYVLAAESGIVLPEADSYRRAP